MTETFTPVALLGWLILSAVLTAIYQRAGWEWLLIFTVIGWAYSAYLAVGSFYLAALDIWNVTVTARAKNIEAQTVASDKNLLMADRIRQMTSEKVRLMQALTDLEINSDEVDEQPLPGFAELTKPFLLTFYALALDKPELPALRDVHVWAKGTRHAREQCSELYNCLVIDGYIAWWGGNNPARWTSPGAARDSLKLFGLLAAEVE